MTIKPNELVINTLTHAPLSPPSSENQINYTRSSRYQTRCSALFREHMGLGVMGYGQQHLRFLRCRSLF